MLSRLSSLTLLALAGATGYVPAQIPSSARPLVNSTAPYLLVATPHTLRVEDSASAVLAGDGLRQRITRNVGRDYRVITRKQMNDALSNFGYPADALLDFMAAKTLAVKVSAPLMVMPTLTRADGGVLKLNARLIASTTSRGVAGYLVSVVQEAGQKPSDLGEEAADQLKPAFKAFDDATGCFDNAATDQKKAIDAAQKALKTLPNFGPAEYCLGALAQARDSTSQEALQHYMNAVQGDPQSIQSYAQMGSIYFHRGDSAKVVTTYQTMLEVDPLDQTLRENAFKIFQAFGRPGAAEEVADAGIARDPGNTDWYDLKSNACLQQEKFSCAVDELERLFQVDSTRADTAYFSKINYAARLADDTTRYAKWAEKGIARYPDNATLLDDANRAYGWAGNAEGAIATARKLMDLDPENLEPVQRTIVLLGQAGKVDDALAFLPLVKASSDVDLKNTFGNVVVNAASKIAGTDLAKADTLSTAALESGMTNPQLVGYANYFIGAHMFDEVRVLNASVRASKQCTDARHYQEVLARARPALEQAKLSGSEQVINAAGQMLPPVVSEIDAVKQMVGAFCK